MEAMLATWQIFILGMGRVSSFVILAPVIGGRSVPPPIKIIIILILTVVVMKVPRLSESAAMLPWIAFATLFIKELIVGFLMGLSISLVLFACQAAGELIGFQMMFSAGSTFLAYTSERSTIVGNFFYIFAILVFVTIDGHHWLIKGLHSSFKTLPVLAMPQSLGSIKVWIELSGRLFKVGLQLALPIMATLFVTNLMLGMMAKTMPQLNIFIVGLPIQILVAFILLFLSIQQLMSAEMVVFKNWANDFYRLIHAMHP